jgi:cystathionine beta-lyase
METVSSSRSKFPAESGEAIDFDKVYDRRQFGSAKWANQWDEFSPRVEGENLLSLWTADMDFRAPETVIARLREAAEHGIYGYTRRDPLHYQIVQSWFERRHDWRPSTETMLPAPGIMPTVAAILRTFTEPGDGVIVQSPVYSPYFEVITGNKRTLRINQLGLKNNKYELDIENFEKLASGGAKIFLLCNPHNPAGRAWTHEELAALNDICARHGLLVISDDIHCDIRLSGRPHVVFSSISHDAADRSFICTAPTKTFNLAGIPTATVSVANKSRRDALLAAMQASFLVNANYFGRLALETAYRTGDRWLDQVSEYVGNNVDYVHEFAEERLPGITPIRPDASFLVWLDAREIDRKVGGVQRFFVDNARVNLYDGRVYGPGGEGFIRLNVGCPRSVVQEALQRMAKAVASLTGRN